jgi:hypothetical protein
MDWPDGARAAIAWPMLDRLFLPFLGLATIALVAFAVVWPQGLGDRSPAPFGHQPVQRTPAMQAAMQRETESSERRLNTARAAVRKLQSQAIAPSQ